jgi:SH3-like domain-containing protein
MTKGFFAFGMPLARSALFNRIRSHSCASSRARHEQYPRLSYQMAMIRQSFRAVALAPLILFAIALTQPLWHKFGGALSAQTGAARAAGSVGDNPVGSATGLPVPRFVSLKSDRINVRAGPDKDQDVRWVYTRAGMPVEITAEFDNWRRVRDWEGAEGWVYHSLLSGKRTAIVVPRAKTDLVPLYASADAESAVVAKLQSGVLASLKSCTGEWCHIEGRNFDGWIRQERIWGAYPHEKVE